MSFDTIPEDKKEAFPCPSCEQGNATKDDKHNWSCDTCEWVHEYEPSFHGATTDGV